MGSTNRLFIACFVIGLLIFCLVAQIESLSDQRSAEDEGSTGNGYRNGSRYRSSASNGKDSNSNAGKDRSSRAKYYDEENMSEETKAELREKQEAARRERSSKERMKAGQVAVQRVLTASSDDYCDWRRNPLQAIRGELCGAHYKVLGLKRNTENLEKNAIKKAYRQISLTVHPDKNPSDDAEKAFKVVQDAYECLSDDNCRTEYNYQLKLKEQVLGSQRMELQENVISAVKDGWNMIQRPVSNAAFFYYTTAMRVWEMAADWSLVLFDEEWPVGRPLLIFCLIWKGQILLQLYIASYIITRIHFEIAKSRGLFD